VIIAGGLMIMAFWITPLGLVLGAAAFALGITLSTPAFFSAIFATASPSERGAASGTASAFIDLGLGAGPILMGVVADARGIPAAFGIGAGIALLGCAWVVLLQTRPDQSSLGTSTHSAR